MLTTPISVRPPLSLIRTGTVRHHHRLLLDPTADDEREAEGRRGGREEEEGVETNGSGGSSKRPRVGTVAGPERGQKALGLLHLAFMAASGEVTQVSLLKRGSRRGR